MGGLSQLPGQIGVNGDQLAVLFGPLVVALIPQQFKQMLFIVGDLDGGLLLLTCTT